MNVVVGVAVEEEDWGELANLRVVVVVFLVVVENRDLCKFNRNAVFCNNAMQ